MSELEPIISLTPSLYQEITTIATQMHIPPNQVVKLAIEEYLHRYQAKQLGNSEKHFLESSEMPKLLQECELEKAYREASKEVEEGWEFTVGDGLTDETW